MQHHAYMYEGPLALVPALALDARARFAFKEHGDPDVREIVHEKFGIDEARTLQSAAALKNISGRMLFIVGAGSITTEAQQALLKLFEEPQDGLMFVLLVPFGVLIPTLRSRMQPYPHALQTEGGRSGGKKFLSMPYKERSTYIATLIKEEDGAKERVREFLAELERALYSLRAQARGNKNVRESLEDIAKVRSYVGDRSASLKMLLEHVALSMPVL